MVSGEGSRLCQLVECQGVPGLKCPRRGKGWELSWDAGREDNWQRTHSQTWPSWVPMFFLLRSREGNWPAPSHPVNGNRNRTEMAHHVQKFYTRCDSWQGLDLAVLAVEAVGAQGNKSSWNIALQGEECNARIKCVNAHSPLPCSCQFMSQEGLGLDQGLTNCGPRAKSSLLPVFVQPMN